MCRTLTISIACSPRASARRAASTNGTTSSSLCRTIEL
jgi:hypothetical protein